MIIFCAGMSRSASTLQYQLVKTLIERKGLGRGIGFYYPHTVYDPHETTVIKAEKPSHWMLRSVTEQDAVAVSIYRDPRDVAVSLHHFFHSRHKFNPSRFDDWTQDEIVYQWLPRTMRWYTTWESIDHLQFRYEDYYPDLWHTMLVEIAYHLNITITPFERNEIAGEFTLSKNTERQRALTKWIDDKDSMLTRQHISPNLGNHGVWEAQLTPQQSAHIEHVYADWMEHHGYL